MIRLRQIEVLVEEDSYEKVVIECSSRLKIKKSDIIELKIVKKSVDARKNPLIYYSYIIDVLVMNEDSILNKCRNNKDIFKAPLEEYKITLVGDKVLKHRPIIVGTGPCGLICAYMLASYGYKPLIIERGKCVDNRVKDVNEFWNNGKLDENSNVCFGEGGAGTFSDGKLNTLVKDKYFRQKKVFEILVENGAPEEILYEAKPHIGTDLLRGVVKNIRNKIIAMGGEFRFNTVLTNIIFNDGVVKSIVINNNIIIDSEIVVLAIGHSARDTFQMLYNKNINMIAKPFAVGVRVQHDQKMINRSQYGIDKHPILKEANYKLTYKSSNGRGVYTFCMCPGGYVVNASNENGGIVINGMSNYARDSGNANSAVIVTVGPDDYGKNPMDGVFFQRELERRAYEVGNGKIPVSLFEDYVNNKKSSSFGTIRPVFKGKYEFANINDIFPDYVNSALVEGICAFGKRINGYDSGDTIIAAPESRTSSPVRIIRDEMGEANYKGIYPAGEGAGYAGGITSAAIDGLITFEKIVSVYRGFNE